MQNADEEAILLARARAAARAEIDWFLAAFDGCPDARPRCATLVRAWHALASLESLLAGGSPPSASEFVASLARGDRKALPPLLRDMPDEFAKAVVAEASSDPWSAVSGPGDREFVEHRRAVLRTFADINRRVRRRLPAPRMPWRKIAAVGVAAVLLAVPLVVLYRPRWRVSYYPNTSLSGAPGLITRVLEPDRNWDHVGPGSGLPNDHFSARYETCLVLKKPANVAFAVGSDDGSVLFVDDRKVVDLWTNHPYTKKDESVALDRGVHTLRLEYFQGDGDARLSFEGRAGDPPSDITRMLHLPASKGPACGH